jgi:hypothetical protein
MLGPRHKFTGAALVVLMACLSAMGQEEMRVVNSSEYAGSLGDLRDKRRALLVVFRSRVVDVSNGERAIIDDVLKADPEPKGRYRWVYTGLAKKLNKYIRKYQSLTAARDLTDADYVIFFNVVEFRRILNASYPYGELFVIVKGSPQELKPPRVVWRAKKVLFADDAIGELIKDLKSMRGEG